MAFRLWQEAKDYIDSHPGCRYKKVRSNKEEDEFRAKWKNGNVKKIYIAVFDNRVYRFDKWDTCKEFVSTHNGAKYKGFSKEEDAQNFINANIHKDLSSPIKDGTMLIFINNEIEGMWSYVAVKEDNFVTNKGKSTVMPNEMYATLKGVEHAISKGEERVIILYNDLGVEMLGNGSWTPHKKGTIDYVKKITEMKKKINVDFFNLSGAHQDEQIKNVFNKIKELNELSNKKT